ncbi:MAG: hypothetical protein ACYC1U_11095 [Candidatus Aquicultorales bacterium]
METTKELTAIQLENKAAIEAIEDILITRIEEARDSLATVCSLVKELERRDADNPLLKVSGQANTAYGQTADLLSEAFGSLRAR